MADREEVISDLEEQIAWIRDNDFHKFPGWGHAVLAMRDALALLKAQEPKSGHWFDKCCRDFRCSECGHRLINNNTSEFGYCNAMPVEFVGQVSDFEEDGKPEWCPLKAQEPVEPQEKRERDYGEANG